MTKTKDATAMIRGLDRKAHFASGGSVREWRGIACVHTSIKRASRGSVKRKAIKEGR